MIELNHIQKVFNRGKLNEVVALKDVSLRIAKGEFLTLTGANGSGKTTLLNIIAGAVLPSLGKIYIKEQDVSRMPEHKRSRWIARVFQNPLGGTAPELSILENFRLAALRTRPKRLIIGVNEAFKQKVRSNIARLGMNLEDKLQQPMGTLSGGQRQALTLLMSVMDDTDILLLDEPTAALDPNSAEVVMQTAKRIIEEYNLTTILITHNLREAHRFGDRLVHMEQGVIARDLHKKAKEELSLQELFEWFK